MEPSPAITPRSVLATLGDARWVRAHVSTLAVSAVMLVSANLLIGSDDLWSLTVIGIWSMLLVVHVTLLIIARLSFELLDEDEEEIVLLPIKDAVFMYPADSPTAAPSASVPPKRTPREGEETIFSWQVATDAAQARRERAEDKPEQ